MHTNTAWMRLAETASGSSVAPPSTRTPWMSEPQRSGTSSMKPTGRYGQSGSSSRVRAICSPPTPAPTTSAFWRR